MKKNVIPVVFNCDNNFVKYLSVTIQSIIDNSSINNNYDLIILNEDISDENQHILQSMLSSIPNFSLKFYNMKKYVSKYNVQKWFSFGHIKSVAYYRLFIFDLLKNYDKAIYLDCDLIVNTDISNFYNMPLKGNLCAAVKDIYVSKLSFDNELGLKGFVKYARDILNIKTLEDYFNSGVMLFDINKINKQFVLDDFINMAKQNNRYFHDQNVLNSLFNHQTKLLDETWNLQINTGCSYFINKSLTSEKVNIFHYCSKYKPWNTSTLPLAYIWWKYARQTPFYEEILQKMLSDNISAHINDIAVTVKNNGSNTFSALPVVNKIKYKLFNCIPLWSRRIDGEKCKYKLLGLPVFSQKNKGNKYKFKLLGLPLFSRKIKGGRTVYKFCGMPLWKIRKMSNNITTKYYFCGIPLLKVSKK